MHRLVGAGLALLLISCSGTTPAATPSVPVASPSATASASPSATASPAATKSPSASPAATKSPTATAAEESGAPSPSESAGALDPCTLLDSADLTVVGGATGSPRAVSPTDWGPECDYPSTSGSVQVVTFRPEVSDAVFEFSDAKVDLSGLGDRAYYDTNWHRVRVRSGADRFQVSCRCVLTSGTEQQILTQLATSAVSHLAP